MGVRVAHRYPATLTGLQVAGVADRNDVYRGAVDGKRAARRAARVTKIEFPCPAVGEEGSPDNGELIETEVPVDQDFC